MLSKVEQAAIEHMLEKGVTDPQAICKELGLKKVAQVRNYIANIANNEEPKPKKKKDSTQFVRKTGGNSDGVTIMTPNQSQMSDDLKPARNAKKGSRTFDKYTFRTKE